MRVRNLRAASANRFANSPAATEGCVVDRSPASSRRAWALLQFLLEVARFISLSFVILRRRAVRSVASRAVGEAACGGCSLERSPAPSRQLALPVEIGRAPCRESV